MPDGRELSGASKGENPAVPGRACARVPGGCPLPYSPPPPPAAAVVKVVPVRIGSLLPTGDICAAEPARRLPGRLAGGSRPGGSHRHQRAGIKGLNGTLAPPGGGGTTTTGDGDLAGSSLPLPPHAFPPPPPRACTTGPAALPPAPAPAAGAPAVAHCSRNQPGLPQAAAVLGATGARRCC